ncbi:OLC1v1024587C1 [Oldenlandia corymbosa var. corymbosa]|uniref:OLC1v1024587C1 n=1 Tax=Oldenlandia corymbosa var. corymbosa TaxID=529605 RepID=A0AAV1C5K1_OLDCO|nr:OLC1v1024587C1 [Oldenlandia corymbosa var. corymbosa]
MEAGLLVCKGIRNYCLSWNHQETEGLGAIKDEWTQKDEKFIEELNADVEKILKYSKVVKWNDVQYYVPPVSTEEDDNANVETSTRILLETSVGENQDDDVTITAAPRKKKNKRIVKISAASMAYLVQLRKLREDLVAARSERDEALFKVVILKEKARQVQAKEAEIALVQAKYDELDEKMKSFASLHISKEELHQWCVAFMYKMLSTGGMAAALEEMNLVATKCGTHRVGVAGLRKLDQDRPIKAKWFKQLLMKDPKKTMHEAMVKVLTRLNLDQLPLWEAVTGALPKMSSPADIASFPGDIPAILARGPSEEDPIPDVQDEYMGIELEDGDEATEEDVADTGHSGVQRNAEDASQNPPPSSDAVVARVQHMNITRTHRFIAAMDILKKKAREIELLTDYIAKLQNLLLDNNIDFEIFEHPEETVDPRTRSSREELLMRVHAQDLEIVDLKNKLNQCVNLLSLHGYKGIIHPSPDNPVREVLVIV